MQVHYVDPAVEAEATENEFFRSLHALNLSPYVLVTPLFTLPLPRVLLVPAEHASRFGVFVPMPL